MKDLYELAAIAGVSPLDDFTPLELTWMAKARAKQEWNHTSCLLALIYNVNSKRKRKPEDFHPFGREMPRRPEGVRGVTLQDIKAAMAGEKKGAKNVSGSSGRSQGGRSVRRNRG